MNGVRPTKRSTVELYTDQWAKLHARAKARGRKAKPDVSAELRSHLDATMDSKPAAKGRNTT